MRVAEVPAAPFAVYNLVLHALLPVLPLALVAAKAAGWRAGRTWRGQAGLELPAGPAASNSIWVQASSVGENRAARQLVSELKLALPGRPLLLTSTTPEGLRVARQSGGADHVAAFPFDYPWLISRWFEVFDPGLCLVVETEIWPNLIRACVSRGIPLALVNGRLSPVRMPRYRRLARFYKAFLSGFSLLSMQSEEDAARALELGADPERVRVAGDLKYDNLPKPEETGPRVEGRYVVAGSTHPGESEAVLAAYARVRHRFGELGLVLAPRHSETADEVYRCARQAGLQVQRRSEGAGPSPGRVLLLDTVGELATLYGLAEVAFVGGSLVPVGGHSLLEPAALGKPVLHGPHAYNFADAVSVLASAGASRQVAGAEELASELERLLASPDEALEMGRRAREAVAARTGATKRTVEALVKLAEVGRP